jgi:uncharacterized protein with HEPN domain
MNSRDQASLLDILQCSQKALAYVDGMTLNEFTSDDKTQSAVLYQIAILGEAVKRLSPEFRNQHPSIDWRAMAGMRDKLIHDYGDTDIQRVWDVVKTNLPDLQATIGPLINPP